MRTRTLITAMPIALASASAAANPIPLPVPASMPLEEMEFSIDYKGHVTFIGDFFFDFIPDGNCPDLPFPCEEVTKMQFPLPPVNPSGVTVLQDGSSLTPTLAPDRYPTVLEEYPTLPMVEWPGPFPINGATFTVSYEHDVIQDGNDQILFYSLGTGKYFPTYDKLTTALIDISLPSSSELVDVLLDEMPLDPALYSTSDNKLHVQLTSEYGPFINDLIVSYRVTEPNTIWLIAIGFTAIFATASCYNRLSNVDHVAL